MSCRSTRTYMSACMLCTVFYVLIWIDDYRAAALYCVLMMIVSIGTNSHHAMAVVSGISANSPHAHNYACCRRRQRTNQRSPTNEREIVMNMCFEMCKCSRYVPADGARAQNGQLQHSSIHPERTLKFDI